MPSRRRTPRIVSAEVQGDDSWVEVKFPTNKKARENGRVMNQLMAEVERIQADEDMPDEEKEAQAESVIQEVYAMLSEVVVAWNWVDDDGNPLPQPTEPTVFDQLLPHEYKWLLSNIQAQVSDEKKQSGI